MKKKIKKRKLKIGNLLVLVAFLLVIIFGISFMYYQNNLKAVSSNSNEIVFTIEQGDTVNNIVDRLEKENIIKNKMVTLIYAKLNNLTNIKMGTYILDNSWDTDKILTYLNSSTTALTNTVSITFIEGDWAKHIATKISENTNVSYDELIALWNDEAYVRSLQQDYPFITDEIFNSETRCLLEGYLSPNTYEFYKETNSYDVTKTILNQTLKVYNKYKEQMKNSELSIHEIYTLASIVQYEASNVDDMKMIAQVFYNRLAINMPLQSSVTVCYALDIEKDDDWIKCEVNPNYDSLYNTYKYNGLPPGPILNPGESAIDAVLNPEYNEYYYFMADVYGDGTVYYAKTLDEHNANVNKYLK